MSLKDLLPPGTYDEIVSEAKGEQDQSAEHFQEQFQEQAKNTNSTQKLIVSCPHCRKKIEYRSDNPYRPFCSLRCKALDLGAWASDEHAVPGKSIYEDLDADLLNDPNLPIRHKYNS